MTPTYKDEALTQLIANLKAAGIDISRDGAEMKLKESDWHMPTAYDKIIAAYDSVAAFVQGKADAGAIILQHAGKRRVAIGNEDGVQEYDPGFFDTITENAYRDIAKPKNTNARNAHRARRIFTRD
jgi:hypothetical protein